MDLPQIVKSVAEYSNLYRTLVDDAISVLKSETSEHKHRDRRFFVRAVFALIESDLYFRKQCALALQFRDGVSFSDAELARLREKQVYISDNGVAHEREYFPALLDNIKFTLRAFARALPIDYVPDFGVEQWEALRRTVRVRNRITHPRRAAEVAVGDDEIVDAMKAFEWYQDITCESLKRANEALAKIVSGSA